MSIIYPEATPAYGNTAVIVALTLSSESAPSLATDFVAPNSLNVSCFLYGTGFSATSETTRNTAPQRLCDVSTREQFGTTTFTVQDLQYTYDPQGDETAEANEAKEMLTEGLEVWIVERNGIPAKTTDLTSGDLVNLHHVRLGKQNRTKTGDGEEAEYSITQGVVYIEDPIYDVAVAA